MDVCLLWVWCCQVEVSASGWSVVLPSVVCLSVIVKPWQWGGPGCRAMKKIGVFWVVTPCSLVDRYCFVGKCSIHLRGRNALPWRLKQYAVPKLWYLSTKLHNVTFQWEPQIFHTYKLCVRYSVWPKHLIRRRGDRCGWPLSLGSLLYHSWPTGTVRVVWWTYALLAVENTFRMAWSARLYIGLVSAAGLNPLMERGRHLIQSNDFWIRGWGTSLFQKLRNSLTATLSDLQDL
jgi:hypothetical protein